MNTRVTIMQLAKAVADSDGFNGHTHVFQIAHVLEIALKTRLGILCLDGHTVDIDLGNGHVLHCAVKKAVGPTDV